MQRKSIIITMILVLISLSVLFAQNLERKGNEVGAKGDELFNQKKYKEAIEKYDEARKIYKKALEEGIPVKEKIKKMETNIFTCYVKLRDYPKIVEGLEKKIAKDPKDYRSVKNASIIYQRKLNNYDKAIAIRVDFDKIKPSFSNRKNIANLYLDKKDYNNAIAWFEKALELKNDGAVIKNIAVIYYKHLKNNTKAIELYTSYLSTLTKARNKAKVYKNLGALYEDINNISKAIANYQNSYRQYYDETTALKAMTLAFDLERYDTTLAIVNDILAKNPGNADAIYFKAQVYFAKEQLKLAKTEFEKIVNNPEYGSSAKEFIKSINSRL